MTLSNTAVSFSKAELNLRTSLFGIRYLMRHWFFTTAIFLISFSTLSMTFTYLTFYFTVKSSLKSILLKLYPNIPRYQAPTLRTRKFSKALSTDDIFSSGSEISDNSDLDTKSTISKRSQAPLKEAN